MRSPEEAYDFEALCQIIMFTGVSDEDGRRFISADANISPVLWSLVYPVQCSRKLKPFNNVRKQGLAFEEVRQANVLRNGEKSHKKHVVLMMRIGQTILMRVKEGSSDLPLPPRTRPTKLPYFKTNGLKKFVRQFLEMPSNVM